MTGLSPEILIGRIVVILLGIPFHEWAHGWMAHVLGDNTPELQGRLSLNPLTHLDPIGTLMILLTGFGWGRAAQVNPYQMWRVKKPRVGMALSALAGPLSNIIQAMIFVIPIRLGLVDLLPLTIATSLEQLLFIIIQTNIGLAAFNLLPIPPLDGSRILAGVAPPSVADFIESLEPIAPLILMGVLFILPQFGIDLVGWLIVPLMNFLIRAIYLW